MDVSKQKDSDQVTKVFPNKKNKSLVRRFQALLMSWGVVVYVMALTGFWLLSNQVNQENAQRNAQLWVSNLDMLSAPLYVSQSDNEFETIRRYIENFSEISYIKLYRSNGVDVFGQYTADDFDEANLPTFDKKLLRNFSQDQLKEGGTLTYELETDSTMMRVIAPVTTVSIPADNILDFDLKKSSKENINVVGYLDLGLNSNAYRKQLTEYVLKGSLSMFVVFLLAAVIGRRLIESGLRPLRDLREPLGRLAKGETDVWVERDGHEEIVAISKALNTTISAIKTRDEKLQRLAEYDPLTGLINKRSFNLLLNRERGRVISQGDQSALFFIDLDQFKYINDTLGHASGDRLLVRIAKLLCDRKRTGDVVSRLGGDEFAVLARSVNKQQAINIAMSIVKSLYDFKFIEQGKTFNIYCSVGISLIDTDEFTTEEIFSHADMACYCAKSQGRNRFYVYEPDELVKDKLDIGWSHRIAEALANDRFELNYQPIVSTTGDGPACFEVLLRLIGSHGEVIAPNAFISIAERFGLATEIDYWVIERAMNVLQESNKNGQNWCFFINLSGQLFADPDFVERVLQLFKTVSIDAGQIVFELTERTAVGDINNASQKMTLLQRYGFKFAVDDFGSGFSSFSYLKHMPVEFVKIEGEFVERITHDGVDRAMVKSMVDIAKACGKKIIAEYVTDKNTLYLLKHYGVDYVQGFFIGKPQLKPVATGLNITLPTNVAALKV